MSVRELRHDRPSGRFSKSRGLSASVSFLSFPPPARSFTYAIFRAVSFFAPKLHENAFYAGYPHPWQEGITVFYRSGKMKDLYNASITSIGTKRPIFLSEPVLTYAFFSWLEICSIKFNKLSSYTLKILIEGRLVVPEPFKLKVKIVLAGTHRKGLRLSPGILSRKVGQPATNCKRRFFNGFWSRNMSSITYQKSPKIRVREVDENRGF